MLITQPLTEPSVLPGISNTQVTMTSSLDTTTNIATVTMAALGTTRTVTFEDITMFKYNKIRLFASYLDEALGFNLLGATKYNTITLEDPSSHTKLVGKVSS